MLIFFSNFVLEYFNYINKKSYLYKMLKKKLLKNFENFIINIFFFTVKYCRTLREFNNVTIDHRLRSIFS